MISHLPNDMLEHILSFCFVNTCMVFLKTDKLCNQLTNTILQNRKCFTIKYNNSILLNIFKNDSRVKHEHQNIQNKYTKIPIFTKNTIPYLDKFYINKPIFDELYIEKFINAIISCSKTNETVSIHFDNGKMLVLRLCKNGIVISIRSNARRRKIGFFEQY